ncbi:hypothetical protein [Limnobacter sp.]|uniref:hypothetical protein n=1 Tax=Limnobacter sp. TaxID=2003368 RepID=UPI00391BFB69
MKFPKIGHGVRTEPTTDRFLVKRTEMKNVFQGVLPWVAALSGLLLTACVAVAPIPADLGRNETDSTGTIPPVEPQPVTLCNIETPDVQELSNGTTKAKVTQTCDSTEVFIANEHKEHPKRCKVQIGQRVNEVYIRPGESRTLTLNAPAMAMRVGLSCVNDWNRPK